ncbi:MAG: multiubiquitin domain-containing protein [Caulobacteraceae bacterium]|nr:multiubiquitin domain-containing protein [Caulobacteraceae bacterium]
MSIQDDIEDIEACVREGRRPRDVGPYRVLVGDALFSYREVILHEPTSTGLALRSAAALDPPELHICFALLSDGLLEEIRLDETFDLRAGVEKFVAFKSDRIFRFLIDGHEYQWGGPFVTGATLLKLANRDAKGHSVAVREADGTDRPLGLSGLVDLCEPGVEIFVTAPLD